VGEFGTQQIQFNLRQDRYSDFGEANTGLLGYGLSFANSWRITASVSNAFKAPTFNDMYYPFQNYGGGYTYSGNPNLQPERSQNREAGLHYAAHDQRVDAVYFNNRISDLIACNTACSTVVNINQAQIDGEELSYTGKFGNTRLKANATFQNPRDTVTGQTLLRRAKKFSNVSVSHDLGDWNTGAEVRYSGARRDYDLNGNTVTLTSYTLLNLTVRYRIDKLLYVSAHIDNLFNRDYSEVYGYNTLGRTLFVGLNYRQ
jgi:vitamin B12 transporter